MLIIFKLKVVVDVVMYELYVKFILDFLYKDFVCGVIIVVEVGDVIILLE